MKKLFVLVIVLLVLFLANDFARVRTSNLSPDNINKSIDRAIDFLYENQLDYGEFKTFACTDEMLTKNCYFDSSPFVTTLIANSIKDVKDERVKIVLNKATDFLLDEEKSGGVWSYYTSKNIKVLTPDLDDTSKVSFILKINQRKFTDNIDLIMNNRNKEGLFFTWISTDEKYNDIDCIVNTNVLTYLGQNIPEVCSFVNNAIISEESCSFYYPRNLIFYYLVSTAYENNISCFESSKEKIIAYVLNYQKDDGSFGNDLDSALSLTTLLNFDYRGKEIENVVGYLLENQKLDGSWKRGLMYVGPLRVSYEIVEGKIIFSLIAMPKEPKIVNFFGSEELTTGVVIEALQKYLDIKSQQKRDQID